MNASFPIGLTNGRKGVWLSVPTDTVWHLADHFSTRQELFSMSILMALFSSLMEAWRWDKDCIPK